MRKRSDQQLNGVAGGDGLTQSFLWKFMEQVVSQGVNIIVQIVLARLLVPEDFGQLAILVVFINFATILVQNGLSTAIVQKQNIDNLDISTLVSLSLGIATVCYFLLYQMAPAISSYYASESLRNCMRILSLVLFPNALVAIQTAILARQMKFKSIFLRSVIAVPVSGAIGITMAYLGYGLWALVVQTLTNQFLTVVVMWMGTRWKFSCKFSFRRASQIFSFSGKILLQQILSNLADTARTLMIGKMYSSKDLAYYDRGFSYTGYIVNSVNSTLASVLLPTFARCQKDTVAIKNMMRQAITLSSFIMFPVLAGFAAVAEPLVLLLLTEKWLGCVPYIMIFCLYRIPYPIITINLQAFYALGRSDITLRITIYQNIILGIILVLCLQISVIAVAWGSVLYSFINILLFALPNAKLVGYQLREQLYDILLPLIGSIVVFLIVWPVQLFKWSSILTLCIQIPLGISVYLILALATRNKCIFQLYGLLRRFLSLKK